VTVLDPMNLSSYGEFEQINSRLEPGLNSKALPARWAKNKKPKPDLAIDRLVLILSNRQRKPKLRSSKDLQIYRLGECPYAMARSGLALALFNASFRSDLEGLRRISTGKLKKLKTELPPISSSLKAAAKIIGAIWGMQERYQEFELDLRSLHDRMLAAVLEIDRAVPLIKDSFLNRSTYRGNLWRIWFVISLSGTWWRLTGSDPSASATGLFLKFVNAAWESLSPVDLPEVNWESAIKTAIRNGNKSWRDDPGHVVMTHHRMSTTRLDRLVEGLKG
jgi:hypothetical protein